MFTTTYNGKKIEGEKSRKKRSRTEKRRGYHQHYGGLIVYQKKNSITFLPDGRNKIFCRMGWKKREEVQGESKKAGP